MLTESKISKTFQKYSRPQKAQLRTRIPHHGHTSSRLPQDYDSNFISSNNYSSNWIDIKSNKINKNSTNKKLARHKSNQPSFRQLNSSNDSNPPKKELACSTRSKNHLLKSVKNNFMSSYLYSKSGATLKTNNQLYDVATRSEKKTKVIEELSPKLNEFKSSLVEESPSESIPSRLKEETILFLNKRVKTSKWKNPNPYGKNQNSFGSSKRVLKNKKNNEKKDQFGFNVGSFNRNQLKSKDYTSKNSLINYYGQSSTRKRVANLSSKRLPKRAVASKPNYSRKNLHISKKLGLIKMDRSFSNLHIPKSNKYS